MSASPSRTISKLIIVLALATIVLTSGWLPDPVASHFGPSGLANGYMTRFGYLLFMAGIAVGVPTLLSLMIGGAIRRSADSVNIPNRDYWVAPARRDGTVDYLIDHTARLAAGVALFAVALHFVLVRANGLTPPRLEGTSFVAALTGALVGVGIWVAALLRRFRLP
jgi:uncharacterized membrane protein